ncbi:hypothetical protein Tco_1041529 [Tanacetum coccineum]|uniref:Uncharacterized protein n=1 Tax=Tanacetum coccineum TaxID=301880 RepID=A0ABQ5GHI9_9ASTR
MFTPRTKEPEGSCIFTDKWSLDELAYGVPTDGPYQTNPPLSDDIISSIRIDREGQVTRIRHEEEIDVHDHQILTREIVSTLKPLKEIIRENVFCLTRKDHGMRRGRHSTYSSSAFDQPSSSHLNDDNDDRNDEGSSLQELSNLYYPFGGFMDYLWSREFEHLQLQPSRQKILPVSKDDIPYSYLIEYPKHSALTARIWM